MEYSSVTFDIMPNTEVARDLLAYTIAEIGFESFEEHEKGLIGYIPTSLYNKSILDDAISSFPLSDTVILYSVSKLEDIDWNYHWEETGFSPINIDNRCVIYDAKHQAPPALSTNQFCIGIDAIQAFGTGTHETTQMMVSKLLQFDLNGKRVLDCGCGTGILSIAASKCGAKEVIGYDIDKWSVENSRRNAQINNVENMEILHGNANILSHIGGLFDVIVANINRNILLEDMPRFVDAMAADGFLLISGFYSDDAGILLEKAQTLNLKLIDKKENNDWCLLMFSFDKE